MMEFDDLSGSDNARRRLQACRQSPSFAPLVSWSFRLPPAQAPPSPLATNLSVGRAVSENPVVLQGFPELAPHCACQETAGFLSECPNSLQTSAPWRFGAEPKTTSFFS